MPNVRVTCLLCQHPVEVSASEVVLHLDGTGTAAGDRYGFRCPACAVYIVRRANQAVVDVLVRTDGVEVATGAVPPWETADGTGLVLADAGRTAEQVAASQAPPITEADVLLFRRALEDDAILAAWLHA